MSVNIDRRYMIFFSQSLVNLGSSLHRVEKSKAHLISKGAWWII
jgi:hypothetical protein